MPKIAKELSALDIKRLTRPGRHAVEYIPGLLRVVKDSGDRSWTHEDRQRTQCSIGRRCPEIA